MTNEIYLDANATCAALPAAIDAALDALGGRFGNPSSSHAAGLRAKAVLDEARARARRVTGAGDGRVMFTSGATEGIQAAVLSVLWSVRERQLAGQPCARLLVYGATEHKAVPESLAHWNRLLGTGLELAALPVDGEGRHRLDVLRELAPNAAMVCTMAANNETGVVSDLDAIGRVLEESGSGARWMVDCVQALGKLALALSATRIDYAPFSGHKLCAPKGIGMLYVRAGAPFTPLIMGGGQEDGQRSGTENMAGIAAFGAVLKALEDGTAFRSHDELVAYRDRLVDALRSAFPGVEFNAPLEHALPTTINFSVPGIAARELLDVFDAAGVRVSAGSACSASKAQPSYVLQAMGIAQWRAASAVRLSFGPHADDAFIDEACARIRCCGAAMQSASRNAKRAAAECVVMDSGECAGEDDMHLSHGALGEFLRAHPDALVVDVREPAEHAVAAVVLHGREVCNVPLSRLAEHAPRWLHGERCPLVFICRSGNRSARAARYLRRIGYVQAWHMSGGLALAG
jgi:cysteine sulfinate desulfinase/cysteine desulfurase-like protein/rhodanese-related sulfurtransferase